MALKTFLQHCKGVCREASIAQGESAITTVLGQTGQLERIVANVRQAWLKIQNMHQLTGLNWRFMEGRFVIATVASQDAYAYDDAAITDEDTAIAIPLWRNWDIKDFENAPKIYLTSAGVGTETWLTYLPWNDFKYFYRIGTQNEGFPAHVTINPQNKLVLGPIPDGIYTVTGNYMKAAQTFTADSDVPTGMPEQFEDAIMYLALSKHGLQKNAVELITLGEDGAAELLGALEQDQLSEIPIAGPLA